jgi:hypothetical protein
LLFLAPFAALACDTLRDPLQVPPAPDDGRYDETTCLGAPCEPPYGAVTISGTLVGAPTTPNLRVALLWRSGTSVVVEGDAAVVDNRFTMNLPTLSDDHFDVTDMADAIGFYGKNVGVPAAALTASPSATYTPSWNGEVTRPLRAAVGALVAYEDTNDNRTLDLEPTYLSSTDRIVGVASEIFVVNLQGGGSLEGEKLADGRGVRPNQGFNVVWREHRWLESSAIEIPIDKVPYVPFATDHFCEQVPAPGITPDCTSPEDRRRDRCGADLIGMPPPSDPKLHCSPDKYGWTYDHGAEEPCPAWAVYHPYKLPAVWPPPKYGLCLYRYGMKAGQCHGLYALKQDPIEGAIVPDDWPCAAPGSLLLENRDGGADAAR